LTSRYNASHIQQVTIHRVLSLLGFFAVLATLSGLPSTAAVVSALTLGLLAAAFFHAHAAVARAGSAKAATWAASLRDRARHTAFLPHRDPDAAGKPRPRAPGLAAGAAGAGAR
jgi:hypothetical protein